VPPHQSPSPGTGRSTWAILPHADAGALENTAGGGGTFYPSRQHTRREGGPCSLFLTVGGSSWGVRGRIGGSRPREATDQPIGARRSVPTGWLALVSEGAA
jgi:hypothetical protein